MENNIIIKADDFKYPSKEERKQALKDYPKLEFFNLEYKNPLESLLDENSTLKEASRNYNLYWWSNCLNNRFGKLQETYIYVSVSYNRGFSDNIQKLSNNEAVNKITFDYYAEIFYYYFISTRGVICQIINLYYSLDINEHKLHLNSQFLERLKKRDEVTESIVKDFHNKTKETSDKRNEFAHKFTPTIVDHRSTITVREGKEVLEIDKRIYTSSTEIIENIKDSILSLKILMHELVKRIK